MCGIAGIAGGNPTREDVGRMLTSIRHRGPDGEGIYVNEGIGLGNVRLAIVDCTPAGAQPMISPDGRYVLVYNGELYNHADFRPALEAEGIQFRGHSDTETLLWLLIRRGVDVLPELNGIFAFAFYDTLERKLLLARDHMGVKPLYLARGRDNRLLFGSEIKTLFATGEFSPRMNTGDVLELLMFHFIAGDKTAFAGVTELLPGHYVEVADGNFKLRRYWELIPTHVQNGDRTGKFNAFRDLLGEAVRRQLMADVPVAIMSSGGLDSGMVTALAGPSSPGMRGFSYRDPDHGYDEFPAAQAVAERYNVDLAEVRIAEQDIPGLLSKLTWHYDEPIPRPHHLAAWAVSDAAHRAGLKILLSGEGGDELFCGYSRYGEFEASMTNSHDLTPLVFAHNRVAVPRVARIWPHTSFSNAYRFWCAEHTAGLDLINRQLLVDQKTFLQHFLQRSDRMGMAASVEVRVPLLDIPLVNLTNSMPGHYKVAGSTTKILLRQAAEGLLPDAVINRVKTPFDMPMAPLLLRDGPVSGFMNDMLLDQPRSGALFGRQAIADTVQEMRKGDHSNWKVVWMLLATEVWMREFRVTV